MTEKPKFAVFDIDGTLIRWQLFHAIVHHLGKHGHIPLSTHTTIKTARMTWKNRGGTDSFSAYEHVLVHAYKDALKGIKPSDYNTIVAEVFDEYKDQTFVYTRDLVQKLKKQGYLLFAISGSQQEIIQKLARHHGFDAAIGATLTQANGQFTGEIQSPVHNKAAALEQLVKQSGATYSQSIAVGDSESDIPMLQAAVTAIAFNPSAGLYKAARLNGWDIVVERKNVIYELKAQNAAYVLA